MQRQVIIKSVYLATILLLLTAIGFVQLAIPPVSQAAQAKYPRANHDAGSVFPMVEVIARLYFLLPVFTEEDRRKDLSLDERLAVEQEFMSLLNRLPDDTITDKMLNLKLVTEAQLSRIQNHRQFINRLAGVGMNGIITPAVAEEPRFGSVLFRPNPQSMVTNDFASGSATVYAYFDSGGYSDKTVFVKWYETDTGRMSLFKQFAINDGNVNYIWIQDREGLPPGKYQVEIYRVNEAFELLSSGSYQIN